MKKSLLTVAAMSFVTVYAQEPEAACVSRKPMEISTTMAEIDRLRSLLQNSPHQQPPELFSAPVDNSGYRPIEKLEYFPAGLFLDDIAHLPELATHQYSKQEYFDITLQLDGISYKHLTCTEIYDEYDMEAPASGIGYHYRNRYFHYRDSDLRDIATVIYIRRATGSLASESRIVKSYLEEAPSSFAVFPNPAGRQISVTFNVLQQGRHDLYLTDLAGRKVSGLLNNKFLAAGRQQCSFDIDLPPGQYYMTIEREKSIRETQKIIIK